MNWHNGQIIDEAEITRLIALTKVNPLPASFQIGERVSLHITMPNKTIRAIGAVVVETLFGQYHGVRYYLAMPIAPGLYVKSGPYRGFISEAGGSMDPDGGLVSADDVVVNLPTRKD